MEVKLLKEDFNIGSLNYHLISKKDKKWYLYKVFNNKIKNTWFEVFAYKTYNGKFTDIPRQVRPIREYEEKGSWFWWSKDIDECIGWLEINNYFEKIDLIKNKKVASKTRLIDQFEKDGTFIKTWNSASDADRNGFRASGIIGCCRGRINTHRGYVWKYHEKGEE